MINTNLSKISYFSSLPYERGLKIMHPLQDNYCDSSEARGKRCVNIAFETP